MPEVRKVSAVEGNFEEGRCGREGGTKIVRKLGISKGEAAYKCRGWVAERLMKSGTEVGVVLAVGGVERG